MDTYQAPSWEGSHTFHIADNFEGGLSSVSNWEASMDGTWHQYPAEDSRFIVENYSLEDTKPSRADNVFQFPNIPEEPQVCSPSEISSPRGSISSPLLSPVSSNSSTSSTSPPPSEASAPSVYALEPRAATPGYRYSSSYYPVAAEPSRAQIKDNPTQFVKSVFTAEQSQLRDRLWEITGTFWWLEGMLEPRGLLGTFIKRLNSKNFECLSCGKKLPRSDRAIDHFRTHILHRPYHCKGTCGDGSCEMAFYTRDCLKSHTAKHEKKCSRCQTTVEDKNLIRHQGTAKCRNFKR